MPLHLPAQTLGHPWSVRGYTLKLGLDALKQFASITPCTFDLSACQAKVYMSIDHQCCMRKA